MNNFYETILTSPAERIYDVIRLTNGTVMYRYQLSDALDLTATGEMEHLLMLKRAFDRRADILLDEPTDENERKYDISLARYATAKEMCKIEFGYNAVIDALNVTESKENGKQIAKPNAPHDVGLGTKVRTIAVRESGRT